MCLQRSVTSAVNSTHKRSPKIHRKTILGPTLRASWQAILRLTSCQSIGDHRSSNDSSRLDQTHKDATITSHPQQTGHAAGSLNAFDATLCLPAATALTNTGLHAFAAAVSNQDFDPNTQKPWGLPVISDRQLLTRWGIVKQGASHFSSMTA